MPSRAPAYRQAGTTNATGPVERAPRERRSAWRQTGLPIGPSTRTYSLSPMRRSPPVRTRRNPSTTNLPHAHSPAKEKTPSRNFPYPKRPSKCPYVLRRGMALRRTRPGGHLPVPDTTQPRNDSHRRRPARIVRPDASRTSRPRKKTPPATPLFVLVARRRPT